MAIVRYSRQAVLITHLSHFNLFLTSFLKCSVIIIITIIIVIIIIISFIIISFIIIIILLHRCFRAVYLLGNAGLKVRLCGSIKIQEAVFVCNRRSVSSKGNMQLLHVWTQNWEQQPQSQGCWCWDASPGGVSLRSPDNHRNLLSHTLPLRGTEHKVINFLLSELFIFGEGDKNKSVVVKDF